MRPILNQSEEFGYTSSGASTAAVTFPDKSCEISMIVARLFHTATRQICF
jgi:hypothetical protein